MWVLMLFALALAVGAAPAVAQGNIMAIVMELLIGFWVVWLARRRSRARHAVNGAGSA